MLRGSVVLTPDQMRLEMAKEQAILREGKKFISLMLINPNMNRIQGAIVLHPTPYLDTITNLTKFHFEERGGPLLFNEGMDGGMHCNMLDCEHNRNFLASMYNAKYWIIEDKAVDAEIRDLANGIKSRVIIVDKKESPEKILSDDELEAQAAKINAELANRKLAKSELKTKKPVRKIIDASAEFAARAEANSEEVTGQQQEPSTTQESVDDKTTYPVQPATDLPAEPVKRGRKKSTLVKVEE